MKTARFGKTGFETTPICVGTWAMGGWMWGGTEYEKSVDAIVAALEAGVNFIDTAPLYGGGLAERMTADALDRFGRDRGVVVSTKCGLSLDENQKPYLTNKRDHIMRNLENSLKNLRVDRIDIEIVHWPDFNEPVSQTAKLMNELYEQGLIKAIGISNFPYGAMRAFASEAPIHCVQPPYNMVEREYEVRVFPYCLENDIGVMVYSPLLYGLLSGKFDENTKFSRDDHRSFYPEFNGEQYKNNLALVARLKPVAERKGVTPAQLAIAWTLANPAVHVSIVGVRDNEQARANAAAADVELSGDERLEIGQLLARHKLGRWE